MVYIIPPNIKKFYDKWNVQNFVLLSLSLQIMLILLAPLRKRTANVFVIWLIWSAYLLADWAANFAVGLISSKQVETLGPDKRADILAFWAPFLLSHLGGPDTLTSFALEDNALWLRHLVGLITQFITTFIVFGQSLPRNNLWVPTVLLFVAGTIKYGERTRALYHANLNKFRQSMLRPPDPGPNYANLMEEYTLRKAARLPALIVMTEAEKPIKLNVSKAALFAEDVSDLEDDIVVVQHAYDFFNIFKGLIVDLIVSFHERHDSRLFFQTRKSEVALKVIAIELNFIYEVLYTKVVVVHSILGYIVRFISWSVVVAALLTFHSIDKKGFHKIDVRITYTLLFGAIGLDTIALFMLIFSDWTVARVKKSMEISFIRPIAKFVCIPLRYFLFLKRINLPQQSSETPESINCLDWVRRILFRRWSEYLYTYDFIEYCLKERPKTTSLNVFDYLWFFLICFIETFGLKDFYDRMRYVSKKPCTKELWNFIFEQLREKSRLANDPEIAKRIFAARGDWILQESNLNSDSANLMSYVVDVDYDQSLLLWHIATELCDTMEEVDKRTPKSSHESSETVNNPDGISSSYAAYHECSESVNSEVCREISKTLSDYMLYLLVMQPTMMSAVAGIGQIRFRDSCEEAKKFFSTRDLKGGGPKGASEKQEQTEEHKEDRKTQEHMEDRKTQEQARKTQEHKEACKRLLAVNTEHLPIAVKGHRSKSVLFDACILAKELRKLPKPNRWKLMSEVWVELLSYAAGHCRANTHAAQLSKGGELITFVWLLMTHLGIVERSEMEESHARAKLFVDK